MLVISITSSILTVPLLTASVMTSRGLALNLRQHIPYHIHKATMAAITREDKKRVKKGEALVNKDELIVLAQEEESFLLEFEAEMRATGQVPEPRLVDPDVPRPARPMAERLGNAPIRDIKDRLGTRVEGTPIPETRDCHLCGKVGHIARNCTNKTAASNGAKPSGSRIDPLAAHKTAGHTCETCNKPGHTTAQY